MSARPLIRLCVASLLVLGCGSARHRFPIGIFGVTSSSQLPGLRAAGFDSFQTSIQDPGELEGLANAARAEGLSLLAYPHRLLQKPSDRTRGWPVEAWYLEDEPDVHRTPAGELDKLSKKVGEWDPRRRRLLVIGEGAPARAYGSIPDVLAVDWYPVPHLALDSLADELDKARAALPEDKPLWAIVQAFDWSEHEQRDPKKPRVGRFPDHAEIRFMSYLAIVHGAAGLFYYTLEKAGGQTLFDVPEQWQALARVSQELRALSPVLQYGVPLPFPRSWNAPGLEGRLWRRRGRTYVMLLSRKRDGLVPFPGELLAPKWRPLFEARRDPAELLRRIGTGSFLAPYQVLVLESRFGSSVMPSP